MRRLLAQGHTVMIQPYLPSVEDPGEMSLVFLDSEFSHAVRKSPVLDPGDGPVERAWERMTFLGLAEPSSAELAVAAQVHAAPEQRFGRLVYSRLALSPATSGEFSHRSRSDLRCTAPGDLVGEGRRPGSRRCSRSS